MQQRGPGMFQFCMVALSAALLLSSCAKIKPYMPVTASDKRAKLPAEGITRIEAITVTKGDTESLRSPNRVESWLRTMAQREITPPPGVRYTMKAGSSLKYPKDALHRLLQCNAHAFGYSQQFTSYVEEAFDYDPSPKSDYAQGTLLVRYLKEQGRPLMPKTDPRCMQAPTQALPSTAVTPVQSQPLASPAPQR